jgi:hypothetical protein
VSPYQVVDSLEMTSAPSGWMMQCPVPSSSRNGSADSPEATLRQFSPRLRPVCSFFETR